MFEGSVHTEALSANAFRDCKRQCCPYYIHVLLTSRAKYSPYILLYTLIKIWGIPTKTETRITIALNHNDAVVLDVVALVNAVALHKDAVPLVVLEVARLLTLELCLDSYNNQ